MNVKGDMKVEIELDDLQVQEIVREDLIKSLKVNRVVEYDEDFEKALIKIIRYYSTTEEYKEFTETFGIKN